MMNFIKDEARISSRGVIVACVQKDAVPTFKRFGFYKKEENHWDASKIKAAWKKTPIPKKSIAMDFVADYRI